MDADKLNQKLFFNTDYPNFFKFNEFGLFVMNNSKVFFYNHHSIWYHDLDD